MVSKAAFKNDDINALSLVIFDGVRLTSGDTKFERLTLALEYPRVVMIVGKNPESELRVKFIQLYRIYRYVITKN